jgi:hypothetical protein
VVHRALCPQSILVTHVAGRQRVKVFNWQVGYRQGTSTSGVSRSVSATSHVDQLVEDVSKAYMAPEALSEDNTGEHLDVFSLGAIAYHVFSGVAPAADGLELSNKLRGTTGLPISSVMNGAGEWLQLLVQSATHPIVSNRTDSVVDFLATLDEVENELTSPERDFVDDPTRAQIADVIEGGYRCRKPAPCTGVPYWSNAWPRSIERGSAANFSPQMRSNRNATSGQLPFPTDLAWRCTSQLHLRGENRTGIDGDVGAEALEFANDRAASGAAGVMICFSSSDSMP